MQTLSKEFAQLLSEQRPYLDYQTRDDRKWFATISLDGDTLHIEYNPSEPLLVFGTGIFANVQSAYFFVVPISSKRGKLNSLCIYGVFFIDDEIGFVFEFGGNDNDNAKSNNVMVRLLLQREKKANFDLFALNEHENTKPTFTHVQAFGSDDKLDIALMFDTLQFFLPNLKLSQEVLDGEIFD